MTDLTEEQEVLADRIEDALVAYDEDGNVFGTSGAGAWFAAKALAPVVAAMLAEAWDEGVKHASPYGGGYLRSLLIENPYRAALAEEGDA